MFYFRHLLPDTADAQLSLLDRVSMHVLSLIHINLSSRCREPEDDDSTKMAKRLSFDQVAFDRWSRANGLLSTTENISLPESLSTLENRLFDLSNSLPCDLLLHDIFKPDNEHCSLLLTNGDIDYIRLNFCDNPSSECSLYDNLFQTLELVGSVKRVLNATSEAQFLRDNLEDQQKWINVYLTLMESSFDFAEHKSGWLDQIRPYFSWEPHFKLLPGLSTDETQITEVEMAIFVPFVRSTSSKFAKPTGLSAKAGEPHGIPFGFFILMYSTDDTLSKDEAFRQAMNKADLASASVLQHQYQHSVCTPIYQLIAAKDTALLRHCWWENDPNSRAVNFYSSNPAPPPHSEIESFYFNLTHPIESLQLYIILSNIFAHLPSIICNSAEKTPNSLGSKKKRFR